MIFHGTSASLWIENRVFEHPFYLHATTTSAITASPFLTVHDVQRWLLTRGELQGEGLREQREVRRIGRKRHRGMLGRRLRSERKAKRLLESCLTPEQRDQLARCGWFKVRVGERTYRIKNSPPSNVELLGDDGYPVKRYCIAPCEPFGRVLPFGDVMLAQKLLLEADESEFLSVAHAQPPWPRPGVPRELPPSIVNLDVQAAQWVMQIRAMRYRCMIEPCGGELVEIEEGEDDREHVRRCHPDLTTVRAGGGASGSVPDMQGRGDGGNPAAQDAQRVA